MCRPSFDVRLSGTADKLIVFWNVAPYLTNIGTARFRRWLVDLAVRLFPAEAPLKMKQISDTLHGTAKQLYAEQIAAFKSKSTGINSELHDEVNVFQLLRKSRYFRDVSY